MTFFFSFREWEMCYFRTLWGWDNGKLCKKRLGFVRAMAAGNGWIRGPDLSDQREQERKKKKIKKAKE